MRFGNSTLPPKNLVEPVGLLLKSMPFPPRKILLALSGGPDSKALLHVCLHLRKTFPLALGVAHVDHRWRKESAAEAALLEQEIEELGLPFHLKVLDPASMKGNLEKSSREARLQFFAELSRELHYEVVLMAHHRDDLAETVLKRVLEGASFHHFYGMQKITQLGDLTVVRPWLEVPKKSILNFLNQAGIAYFHDATNLDGKYLRGRMRSQLFPFFETHFGKSIGESLARLSRESRELSSWMRNRLENLLHQKGLLDRYLDVSSLDSSFEMRFAVREWASKLSLNISYQGIDMLVELLFQEKIDRCLELASGSIEVDRRQLFFVPKGMRQIAPPLLLRPGLCRWGAWEVIVRECSPGFREQRGWKCAWAGMIATAIPAGNFFLGAHSDVIEKEAKMKLSKHWSARKVPAFFRSLVPVIGNSRKGLQREFLSDFVSGDEEARFEVFLQNTFTSNILSGKMG